MPLRKSLLGRLLAVSALVAVCSVAATAWLAAQTTSGAIKREQGRNLADDARIYRDLLGHAATNAQWDGVERQIAELSETYDRRIALVNPRTGLVVADSATERPPPALPEVPAAVINPLNTDIALVQAANRSGETSGSRSPIPADGAGGGIDPRAVGPFRLTAGERARSRAAADRIVSCLREYSVTAERGTTPAGRSYVRTTGLATGLGAEDDGRTPCDFAELNRPTPTEQKALTELNKLSDACLSRNGRKNIPLAIEHASEGEPRIVVGDYAGVRKPEPFPVLDAETRKRAAAEEAAEARIREGDRRAAVKPAEQELRVDLGLLRTPHKVDSVVENCVDTARRDQLGSYVSAPAHLYIGDHDGGATVPGFDLSPENTARIAGVAALVLALTVGASVLAATRLVRPLRALTSAAQLMKDGESAEPVPVPVRADNEIGRLATAFNDMAAHRARLENQRREMVGDVAHELRTPLSTIRGWLEGAQDGVADLDPAFVSSLLEEAVQLQHIIDDLQDLAQADAGELRLSPAPVRIGELLTQVAAAHAPRAEPAGVRLTVICPEPDSEPAPELTADPVRLRQAVGNLVSNAVRHTPRGGTVTLRAARARADTLTVEVADTGGGIPADDLPYVFDRFWRADKSRNRRTGGSGLGLAIVRKLAEAHGGSVSVRSTLGEGSVFTLHLPTTPPPGTEGMPG
ncbi:HAMP domain-containing sensor histidine kinase [Streptomyces sp. NPDC006798]|uniref:sensor histidine kinase n=1 Tax=Streptomyces sp. NPDC006798 TaxID=3155462 RepID=UPI0033F8C61B